MPIVEAPYGAEEARRRLVAALRADALVTGEVVLTSGAIAQYLVDVKRAILLPEGFFAAGVLIADQARALGATAVGGLTMGADPLACAALAGGADVKAFFVRKEAKQHGLSRRIEGQLEKLGGERAQLEAALADPETYTTKPAEEGRRLTQRHAEVVREIGTLEERWLEVMSELEERSA